MKVEFLVCGTQKAGTSAFSHSLSKHPAIGMAWKKEVHFFDNESHFEGKPDYAFYHSFFRPLSTQRIKGESTPIYMYWKQAPERIWRYNPAMKIIVILRNPITRAYSHWNMERLRNAEPLSFWEALNLEKDRSREALPAQHRVYSYMDRGFYLKQLERLAAFFPPEQCLILKYDDFKKSPCDTLQRAFAFLDLPPLPEMVQEDVHVLAYPAPMGERERDYLRAIFEYEIRCLEQLLGWDCSDWLVEEKSCV